LQIYCVSAINKPIYSICTVDVLHLFLYLNAEQCFYEYITSLLFHEPWAAHVMHQYRNRFYATVSGCDSM